MFEGLSEVIDAIRWIYKKGEENDSLDVKMNLSLSGLQWTIILNGNVFKGEGTTTMMARLKILGYPGVDNGGVEH